QSNALATWTASVVGSCCELLWRPKEPPAYGTLTYTSSGSIAAALDAPMRVYSGDSVAAHTSRIPSSRMWHTALLGSIGACARYGSSETTSNAFRARVTNAYAASS